MIKLDFSAFEKPNALDKFVGYLAPQWQQKRQLARFQSANFQSIAKYAGASKSGVLRHFHTAKGDADEDLLPERETLIDRSRELTRNNTLAAGAVKTIVTSSIGNGLKCRSRIDSKKLGISSKEQRKIQSQIESEFNFYAYSKEIDYSRTLDFFEIQKLALRSTLESGDVFANMPLLRRAGSPYLTKIQLIESDQCNNPNFQQDGERLKGGIQKDAYGAPVFYHFQENHPGSNNPNKFEWKAIRVFGKDSGRRNILHLFQMLRPGQSRGIPLLSTCLKEFKKLEQYTEAELEAALISAYLS